MSKWTVYAKQLSRLTNAFLRRAMRFISAQTKKEAVDAGLRALINEHGQTATGRHQEKIKFLDKRPEPREKD